MNCPFLFRVPAGDVVDLTRDPQVSSRERDGSISHSGLYCRALTVLV